MIRCQWVTAGAKLSLNFISPRQREKYITERCNRIKECGECPIYQMLWERM